MGSEVSWDVFELQRLRRAAGRGDLTALAGRLLSGQVCDHVIRPDWTLKCVGLNYNYTFWGTQPQRCARRHGQLLRVKHQTISQRIHRSGCAERDQCVVYA
jgi:hypothetical protein